MAGKNTIIPYGGVAVSDDTVKHRLVADGDAGHYHAVSHHGLAADSCAAEYNGIFDRSVNYAAIGDKRIFNLCAETVFCGDLISDAGQYRAVGGENRLTDLRI